MSKQKTEPSPSITEDQWVEAIRLALETIPEPPPELRMMGKILPPATPEALLEWLPYFVAALRKQCGRVAREKANRQARRGFLRGQGGREVARAVEGIGQVKEAKA